MTKWNPTQYERFIKDRTQPAIDLANRLETLNPDNILDLGCGPGNSTKVLKDKYPNSHYANGDLNEISDKFDIVFSNACIQWLPNHRELLPKLMTLLKPNGILAIQIPIQREHPVHIIINQLSKNQTWNGKIVPRQYNNLTTKEYFDVLSHISSDFEVWETTYCHRMPSYESIIEWYKGTGLRPYLEQLSESDANEFVNDVYKELQQRYQVQNNGEILFRFPKLFFIVKKI